MIALDWERSDFRATWTREDCGSAGNAGASAANHGLAIPKLIASQRQRSPNATSTIGLGSCATVVDAARAKDFTPGSAVATDVSLRAAVIGESLWTEVDGGRTGTLQILTAAAASGDGDYGGLGCASEAARPVFLLTVRLADGHVEGEGATAKSARIVSRSPTSTKLEVELPDNVGRLAFSYRSPSGNRLDSARLDAAPAAASLPPLAAIWDEDRRCTWESGIANTRQDNAQGDPILPLRPRD